jgi:hypothetical protein
MGVNLSFFSPHSTSDMLFPVLVLLSNDEISREMIILWKADDILIFRWEITRIPLVYLDPAFPSLTKAGYGLISIV